MCEFVQVYSITYKFFIQTAYKDDIIWGKKIRKTQDDLF